MAKKFTQREKDIYRLGFRNGENQLQQTINCIKATQANLVDEMLRLDLEQPVLGDPKHITITLKALTFRKMANALKSQRTARYQIYHYGAVLQNHIDMHDEKQKTIAENIRKMLLEGE